MARFELKTCLQGARATIAAVLLVLGVQAQASLTTHSSSASFLAALGTAGTDDITATAVEAATSRSAGSFDYTVGASSGIRALQHNGANYVGNNVGYEWVTFTPSAASAIGGQFFGSDVFGGFKAGGVTLRVLDSLGEDAIFTIAPSGLEDAFFGVTSTGTIRSLWVHADQGATPSYLAVGSVTIGTTSAVPEPSVIALMAFGLFVVGVAMSGRSRRSHATEITMLMASKQESTHTVNKDATLARSFVSLAFSAFVGVACGISTTAAAVASSSPPTAKMPPGAGMTYEQMVKAMGAAQQTDKMRARLVGKSVRLKLKKSGPTSFAVADGDGISFRCEQSAPTFKGGAVRSQITDVEDTAEGNFMVSLQRCE
jgi:hypothetical protein